MKTPQSLRASQRAMRRRQQSPRPPGRPRLKINEDVIIEWLLAGYSRRGIAIALGCSERTLERRFADLFRSPFDLTKLSRQLLFRLAVQDKNPRALLYCARKSGVCRRHDDDDWGITTTMPAQDGAWQEVKKPKNRRGKKNARQVINRPTGRAGEK